MIHRCARTKEDNYSEFKIRQQFYQNNHPEIPLRI